MKLFILCLALFLSNLSYSQQGENYFDSRWMETAKDNAAYISKYKLQDSVYKVDDYYANGKLYRSGFRTSIESNISKYRVGHYVWYDSLGFKTLEGDYKNGNRVGSWKHYYTHSTVLASETISNDSETLLYTSYDSATQKLSNKTIYKDGDICYEWKYSGGDSFLTETSYTEEKKGKSKTVHYANGKISAKYTYQDGKEITHECFDLNGSKVACDTTGSGKKFLYVEKMPAAHYVLNDYLAKNIHYPKYARKKNIEGRVIVKFVVDEDGSISNVEIKKGIGGGCDEEAIRVVSEMPAWIPGSQNGKLVRVYFTLPIHFKLD